MKIRDSFQPEVSPTADALPALLKTAEARLRRQSRYARPLAKGGRRAAGVEELLNQASACVAALSWPASVVMPVQAVIAGDFVRIENDIDIDSPDLINDLASGGMLSGYLLTLGFDQSRAFDWLGRDYAAHHVQSDLSSEVLFALGRRVFQDQRELVPEGRRLKRVPVQTSDICGQRRIWDPARVQALIDVFGATNPGVSVTNTGCFQPLNSIIGLTVTV